MILQKKFFQLNVFSFVFLSFLAVDGNTAVIMKELAQDTMVQVPQKTGKRTTLGNFITLPKGTIISVEGEPSDYKENMNYFDGDSISYRTGSFVGNFTIVSIPNSSVNKVKLADAISDETEFYIKNEQFERSNTIANENDLAKKLNANPQSMVYSDSKGFTPYRDEQQKITTQATQKIVSTIDQLKPKTDCSSKSIASENLTPIEKRIKQYSEDPRVALMIKKAQDGTHIRRDRNRNIISRNKNPNISSHHCYMHVKIAMDDFVTVPMVKIPAKEAGPELKANGFVNLMEDPEMRSKIRAPSDAPYGAILVYAGKGAGHIEIKGKNEYVSDYTSDVPVTGGDYMSGNRRQLIGVYIK